MPENYYIYEIGSHRIVEVIDVEDEDFCPTDGLEYDWSVYSGTWNPNGLIVQCRVCGSAVCLDEYGLCRHCAAERDACSEADHDYIDGYDF